MKKINNKSSWGSHSLRSSSQDDTVPHADHVPETLDQYDQIFRAAFRAAKYEAEETTRQQALFIANTNHELRTPMQAVMGMTDLLLDTPLTKKQQSYLLSIRSSSDVLLKIIDDIIDYSALEAGQVSPEQAVFDVDDIVEPVFAMLAQTAYSKDIELAYRCHVDGGRATADQDRVRQVLLNLVGNAIKFTDHGEVVVTVSRESDTSDKNWIRFAISDTGVGIDPSRKDEMFRPFSQLASSSARTYGGTGLGLAISKRLVELMGGSIGIEAGVDGGSVAWFRVPAAESLGDDAGRLPAELAGVRVLIVDNNPVIGEAALAALRSLGMRADLETSGAAALDRLTGAAAGDAYRVAMVDVQMPGMDGVAMARRVRSQPSLESIALILLTSLSRPLQPGVATSLEAVCIDKPVLPRLLCRTIQNALSPSLSHRGESAETPALDYDSGTRVLVADDNPVSREVFSAMASTLGVAVDVVEDGAQALQAIAGTRYELIFLDCQMPEMDGYTVATRLRRRHDGVDRPVIVAVSATASAQDRTRCLHAGMDDYLPKPVRLEVLQEALTRWLPRNHRKPAARIESNARRVDASARSARSCNLPGNQQADSSRLVELFIEDSEQRLSTLSRMLEQGSGESRRIAREAHALKSGCLYIEAIRMAALSSELEETARDGTLEPAAEIVAGLSVELDRFRRQQKLKHEHR